MINSTEAAATHPDFFVRNQGSLLGELEARVNPSSISTDWQNVHDNFFVDTQEGALLTPTQVISLVRQNASHYVGITPNGPEVFSVMPVKPRTRFGQPVSLEVQLAMQHAQRIEFFSAIAGAADSGLITYEAAVRQAGGVSPDEALLGEVNDWNYTNSMNATLKKKSPSQSIGTVFASDASANEANGGLGPLLGTGLAVGFIAETGVSTKNPKKDNQGRRFTKVKALRWGVNGVVASSLVLSACTPISPAQPGRIDNPGKTDSNVTSFRDLVNASTKSWYSVAFGSQQYQFDRPVEFLTQDGSDELIMLHPTSSDAPFNSSDRWAAGRAVFVGKDQSVRAVPFFVRCDAQGNPCEGYALVTDEAASSAVKQVFRLGEAKNGKIELGKWSMAFDGDSLWLVDSQSGKSTKLAALGSGSPTQPDQFKSMLGSILANAFKLAEQQATPTAKTVVPTAAPLPSPTPEARNWNLNPPKTLPECCTKFFENTNSYSTVEADKAWDIYNATRNLKDDLANAKKFYREPLYFSENDINDEGKFGDNNIGATLDAIVIGSFGIDISENIGSDTVSLHIEMGVYLPVDSPDRKNTIVAIKQISFIDAAGKKVMLGVDGIGYEDIIGGIVGIRKNIDVKSDKPGLPVLLYEYVSPAEVGMYEKGQDPSLRKDPKFRSLAADRGEFLMSRLGMESQKGLRNEITAAVKANGNDGVAKLLAGKISANKFIYLHKIVIKSIPGAKY